MTYFQFWFDSYQTLETGKQSSGTRAATSLIPVPYGHASSWPGSEVTSTCTTHGSYDSRVDPLISGILPRTITKNISFPITFRNPPVVAVWLTGLGAESGATVAVEVAADEITKTDFVLKITSGDGDQPGSVGVSWAVWPAPGEYPNPRTTVVSVCTVAPGVSRVLTLTGSGTVPLAAVCAINLVLTCDLWIDVAVTSGRGGFSGIEETSWNMKAGPVGATVYSTSVVIVVR